MRYRDILGMSDKDVIKELNKHVVVPRGLDFGQRKRLLGTRLLKEDRTERLYYPTQHPFAPWTNDPGLSIVFEDEVGYKTGSGNTLSFLVQLFDVDREDIPLVTEWEQLYSCSHGMQCKGSSGSCPGFAPRFDRIKPSEPKFTLLAISIDMAWSLQYAKMLIPSWKNFLTWTDRLSSTYVIRLVKGVFKDHFALGLGSCAGKCKPCAVIQGEKCIKPTRNPHYSMEATGVDCNELHLMLYDNVLPWSYRGIKVMQTYMTRYAGAYVDASRVADLLGDTIKKDKSYIDFPPAEPELHLKKITIPTGIYKGHKMYGYDVPKESTA